MSETEQPAKEFSYSLGGPEDGKASGRQGHSCCGGCCDMRRAVIIVNMVNCALLVIGLLGMVAVKNVSASNYDDDEVAEIVGTYESTNTGLAVSMVVLRLLAAGAGIFGALKYNMYMVGAGALSYVVEIILAMAALVPMAAVLPALFLYPHGFLIKEIRAGIMSEQTYPNEKQSCCCV